MVFADAFMMLHEQYRLVFDIFASGQVGFFCSIGTFCGTAAVETQSSTDVTRSHRGHSDSGKRCPQRAPVRSGISLGAGCAGLAVSQGDTRCCTDVAKCVYA